MGFTGKLKYYYRVFKKLYTNKSKPDLSRCGVKEINVYKIISHFNEIEAYSMLIVNFYT